MVRTQTLPNGAKIVVSSKFAGERQYAPQNEMGIKVVKGKWELDLVSLSSAWRRGAQFTHTHKNVSALMAATVAINAALSHLEPSESKAYRSTPFYKQAIAEQMIIVLKICAFYKVERVLLPVDKRNVFGKLLVSEVFNGQKKFPGFDIDIALYSEDVDETETIKKYGNIVVSRKSPLDQGYCFVHIPNRRDYA